MGSSSFFVDRVYMTVKKLLIFICLFPVSLLAQDFPVYHWPKTDTVTIKHALYQTTWSHAAKYPVKVHWVLRKDMLNCPVKTKRTNKFTDDPLLKNSNYNRDYLKSGYDKGHQMNAGDNSCSSQTYPECWYFTNMSPQLPALNRVVWKNLEEACRKEALKEGSLDITCGNIGNAGTIGINKVQIPTHCWKVVKHLSGITNAYLMPNADTVKRHPYTFYKISIKKLNKLTGLTL